MALDHRLRLADEPLARRDARAELPLIFLGLLRLAVPPGDSRLLLGDGVIPSAAPTLAAPD
jgi:hypothetical protein